MSKSIKVMEALLLVQVISKKLLIQEAASFIYTTALPPSAIGASIAAIEIMEKEPTLGIHLQKKKSTKFRAIMNESGIDTMNSKSQIIPIVIGDNQQLWILLENYRKRV